MEMLSKQKLRVALFTFLLKRRWQESHLFLHCNLLQYILYAASGKGHCALMREHEWKRPTHLNTIKTL